MIHFGTGGWRAVIGDGFTKENIQKVAQAVVQMMEDDHKQKKLIIGYDRRFLSKEAAQWFSEILAEQGVEVLFINKSQPTPLVMFAVQHLGTDFGAMVTASHNPALYNGIKIFTTEGRDASVEVTTRLEEYANHCQVVRPQKTFDEYLAEGKISYLKEFNPYIDSILSKLDTEAIRNADVQVCLDPMYGVSQSSLQTILSTLRVELSVIHNRHDTLFGGKLPAPNAAGLNELKDFVVDNHCDFGIATDGDADRLGVIDDKGRFVHPNQILMLLYYYLLKYKGWRGPAVRNNSTTHMLDRIAKDFGQVCYEVPVGFKYVSGKMQETDAIIGGESSGGLAVKGHTNGKDGIYAAAILTEMVAVSGKSISENVQEIVDRYGTIIYTDREFPMTPQRKEELKQKLLVEKQLPEWPYEVEKVSYEDGCKTYFRNGGWLIARFSGTEPLLRFACEMPSQEEADAMCDLMRDFLGL